MTSPTTFPLPRPLLLSLLTFLCLSNVNASSDSSLPASPALPAQWQNAPATSIISVAAKNASSPEATLTTWWSRLGDPILDELIRNSLQSSPDIRSALSRIEQARASRKLQVASLLPSLSLGTSARASRSTSASSASVVSGDSYAASLDASWEIDLFGKQRKHLSAAEARQAASVENLHNVQASLAAEVANTYINLRASQQKLQVAKDNLRLREQTHEITLFREKAGRASNLDALQSSTSLEQTRAAIPALEQSISEARNQLTLLAGKAPGTFDVLLNDQNPIPTAPSELSLAIPADTLRQRPDVRSAELSLRAATAETSAARRSRFPSLNLSGSFGVNSLMAERLFRPEATALALIGSLSAPLFDGGRIRQNITIASESEKQAFIAWESSILTALSEVENALVAISRDDAQLAHLKLAADSSHEAAVLAALQYEAGMSELLTVLDTQRTELSARDQLLSVTAARTQAHVQLFKALGGGWSAK